MRVFVCADMEGVSGIVKRRQTDDLDTADYARACELFSAEVQAAVDGARDAGAEEIVVADSHGPATNLDPRDFADDVRLVQGWPRPLNMMEGIQEGRFDAAVLLGHHTAITSRHGNFPHTVSSGTYSAVRVDGIEVSEAQLNTWIAGHYGVPIVAATGDDVLVDHIRDVVSGVETVATKRACGMYAAEQTAPMRVLTEIRTAVQRGVLTVTERQPVALSGPLDLDLCCKERFLAHVLSYLPAFELVDSHTVRAHCEDIVAVIRIVGAIPHLRADWH